MPCPTFQSIGQNSNRPDDFYTRIINTISLLNQASMDIAPIRILHHLVFVLHYKSSLIYIRSNFNAANANGVKNIIKHNLHRANAIE